MPARARAERRDLLIELGTEELPPKALRTLELALADGIATRLRRAGLRHGAIESFATPRRLAVLVRRLCVRQSDQQISAARTAAQSQFRCRRAAHPRRAGVRGQLRRGLEALARERDANGTEYLHYAGLKSGAAAIELLPGLVQAALDALPIPRRMRWGALEVQFVRPVHWVVMLLGNEIVPGAVLGIDRGARPATGIASWRRPADPDSLSGHLCRHARARGKVRAAFAGRRDRDTRARSRRWPHRWMVAPSSPMRCSMKSRRWWNGRWRSRVSSMRASCYCRARC